MTGDILLQKRSGFLGWLVSLFTRSEYVHVGIDMGTNIVCHVDMTGKHFDDYREWGEIIRLTPVIPFTEGQQAMLVHRCHLTKVRGYSYWHAFKSWFYPNSDDEARMGKYYHCSGFVSAMYRKIGIDLVPNCADGSTQPHHFLESDFLTVSTNA